MHAEAVKEGALPSRIGLMQDSGRVLRCDECGVHYLLHYDNEAEESFTLCSVLASEIITARHPDHGNNIVLELTGTVIPSRRQAMHSVRMEIRKHEQDIS